jgi:mannose-1-phosphate guanylyltransferase
VNGRPLLGYWLTQLAVAGVTDVRINTSYLAGLVEAYLAAGRWDCNVEVVREPVLRGTGGTLIDLLDFWRHERVLLIHADNLTDMDLGAFSRFHVRASARQLLTLATFDTAVPAECGIVVSDGEGIVREFHEKQSQPPGNRASAAIFALSPDIAGVLPATTSVPLDFSRDVVPGLLGRMRVWHHAGFHRDIGEGGRYLAAQWQFPAPPALPDPAWSALLDADGGALRQGMEAVLGELAREAGYKVRVLEHTDELAGVTAASARDLNIVLRARHGYSPAAAFRDSGVRSVVVEVEDGDDEPVRQ